MIDAPGGAAAADLAVAAGPAEEPDATRLGLSLVLPTCRATRPSSADACSAANRRRVGLLWRPERRQEDKVGTQTPFLREPEARRM